MPTFEYKIRTTEGDFQEGVIEGADRYEVARNFTSQGSVVVSIEEKGKKGGQTLEKINLFFARVKMQDLIIFARNLAAMIDAGLALARALSVLEKQTKNPKFKLVIADLRSEIAQGNSMSDAMKKHPKEFNMLFTSMVRAGEEAGNLSESLRVVAEQLDKSYQLHKKIRGAMIYPSVVLSAMVIIGILMFLYVVPVLVDTFKSLNVELPTSTKVVMWVSETLVGHPILLLGGTALAIFLLILALRTKPGRRLFEKVVLHLPVIEGIAKESNSARTTRTLSSLLSSGVSLIVALGITKDVLQNSHYKDVVDAAVKDVEKGVPLSHAFLERDDLYPPLVGEMMEVGEETGKLSEMLLNTAHFYESEVDEATKNLSTIIEPVLMILIGSAVGFFAVSMLTPMYSVMTNI
jgi:type IV pilus assembly protein PilC